MTDLILKYLSPIALAGLIWGIFQFFQKRKYQKRDLRRQEILKKYEEFHSILNLIKNEYWKLMTIINQTTLTFEKKSEQLAEDLTTLGKQIDHIKISSKFDLSETEKQFDKIKKEDYVEKKHKAIFLKLSSDLEERNKQINKETKLIKKKIKKHEQEIQDINSFLKTKDEENLSDLIAITSRLQEYILELNKIPLIRLNIKNSPELFIFELIKSVQDLINYVETIDETNENYLHEILKADFIKEAINHIFKIEDYIYKELKI